MFFSPQDPLDPAGTAIVISSLVPGGVAERGGQILPGDRLVFVNEKHLDGASLAEAVEVLKSVPPGTVSLGICKPLVVRTGFNYYFFSLFHPMGFVGRIQHSARVRLGNSWAAVPWEGQKSWQMGSSVSKPSILKFHLQEHRHGAGRCAWTDPCAQVECGSSTSATQWNVCWSPFLSQTPLRACLSSIDIKESCSVWSQGCKSKQNFPSLESRLWNSSLLGNAAVLFIKGTQAKLIKAPVNRKCL